MIILKVLGIVLGVLVGIFVLYLIVLIFGPGFKVAKQPFPDKSTTKDLNAKPPKSRKDVSFDVGGIPVSAWLYLPEDLSVPVPCILMNQGFGGTKDMILEQYALRFREVGLAVLTYDYRYFGESGGEPRQMFSISSQLEDCLAAIQYVRELGEIDSDKIAVWGTSAGGGYGLAIAAQDRRIACVCAQCPALNSKEDSQMVMEREGMGFFLRLFVHAQRDMGRSRFGLSAHKIPIAGKSRSLAMMTAPGAFSGYAKLAPEGFINEVCARSLFMAKGFNPINYAEDVRCPVLLQICEKDKFVSMNSALETAKILGEYAEVKQYPIGHFDIYLGEYFERSVRDQIVFFKDHL